MNQCLICGEKIAGDKIVCKECWEEGYTYWEETNINFYKEYKNLYYSGKEETNSFAIDIIKRKLVLNAIAYYYENERDTELLDRLEKDFYDLDDEDYDDEIETQCVICGEEANGYWFCPDCYREYKNKEVTVRFTRCTETEVLDATYESVYICDDGHRVKSKSEQAIDNWLYANKIWHVYEKEFQYGNNIDDIIHPDFYLPDYNLYIEHWGFTDDDYYQQQMQNKLKIYKKEKVTLICLYEKTDGKNINRALEYKLKHYKKGQINFEE